MPVRRGKGATAAPGGGTPEQSSPAAGTSTTTQAPRRRTPPAADPAARPLSPREARFCELYLVEPNGQKAAEGAGYASGDSSKVQAARLLTRANVAARLAQLRAERSARTLSDADKVIRELEGIGYVDPIDVFHQPGTPDEQRPLQLKPIQDWPVEARRAIAGIKTKHYEAKTDREGRILEEPYDVMEIKFWNKVEVLRMLGTHHGLRFSRTELTGRDGEPLSPAPSTPQVFVIAGQRVEFQ